ncbi:MAG: putative alpha-1,2-mannosidase [Flavobacteriales bacterium]|jgi:putative alpha-1,2-mannosidase
MRYHDVDGDVRSTDSACSSNLSLWDTPRTVHPWCAMTAPGRRTDCLKLLLAMAEQSDGRMPR